jgi:hypothetical protein
MAAVEIYLFFWTPILKLSTSGGINIGFIFLCMVLAITIGVKLYEVLIIYYNFGHYMSLTGCLFIQGLLLLFTYFHDNFLARLLYLSLFNGLVGFYNPLNSIVKSNILVEEYRASLMNLYRIPLNIYVIIVLVALRYMNNPFTIVLIAGCLVFISSIIGAFLCFYSAKQPEKLVDNRINILENETLAKKGIIDEPL